MKVYFTAISIFILAISIISSAYILSNSLNEKSNLTVTTSTEKTEYSDRKPLLSKEQAADYLGISVEEFDRLDSDQVISVGEGIPYLEANENKYYTTQALEKWLSDTNHYRK